MPRVEVVDFRIDEPEVEDLIRRVYLGQLTVETPNEAAERLAAVEA